MRAADAAGIGGLGRRCGGVGVDGDRFDALAKTLARSTSRRPVVRLLAGGLVALLPGVRGAAAECRRAGRSCSKDAQCCTGICGEADDAGKRRCACPPDLTNCHGDCVDPAIHPSHCGDCDNSCGADGAAAICVDGKCENLTTPSCPECGDCQYCDPAADSCVPCADSPNADDHCRTATLCAAANRDPAYLQLHAALLDRGFARDGEPQAVVLVTGGTPSGSRAALGSDYVRAGEEATLVYVPGPDVAADSWALVLTDGTPTLWLSVGTTGRVEEQPVPPDDLAAGGVRAFPDLVQAGADCADCDAACDKASNDLIDAIRCGRAAYRACSGFEESATRGVCVIDAALVCEVGGTACRRVICEMLKKCPRACDPACERAGSAPGICVSICSKPNTVCQDGKCECRYVECGDACCAAGEVCNKGTCAPKCDPCWFPNNSGQCFELCDERTECCVGEKTPDGACCTQSEHCCDGVCKNKREYPKCGSGGHPEECCEEGAKCLTASEGGEVCCDPSLACGDLCCAPAEHCTSPGCCCDGINYACRHGNGFGARCNY